MPGWLQERILNVITRHSTPKKYPADSTYYVQVAVNGQAIDPLTDVVEIALLEQPTVRPKAADWNKGSWKEDRGRWFGRLLVGRPSEFVLPPATWQVWLRVTTSHGRYVRHAGSIDVT